MRGVGRVATGHDLHLLRAVHLRYLQQGTFTGNQVLVHYREQPGLQLEHNAHVVVKATIAIAIISRHHVTPVVVFVSLLDPFDTIRAKRYLVQNEPEFTIGIHLSHATVQRLEQ